jgi:phytanoyl-CoA hydroxylase
MNKGDVLMNIREIADRFHDDGCVVVRGVFSPQEIAAAEKELDVLIRTVVPRLHSGNVYFEDGPGRLIKSMFRLEQHSTLFRAMLADERLLRIARGIFPRGEIVRDAVSYFGKPARDGSVTPPHQDNFFQHWEPPMALTVTVSIDASTPENGALICAKGSHRKLFPHHPSGVMGFSMTLDDPVDTTKYPEVHLCLEPGDIAIHHIAVIHRSEANRSDRSRRQLAIGYRSSLAKKNEESAARHKRMLEQLHAANQPAGAAR